MDPATSRSPSLRSLVAPLWRTEGGSRLPEEPRGPFHPAGDHQKLAVVRLSLIGGMAVLLPPLLALLGYPGLMLPVFLGALTLLAATVIGYVLGSRTRDLRGAWLFYAGADTLVIIGLGLLLGNFMDVFLIVVVVELARIYRHGRLVIIGSAIAATLMLVKYLLVQGMGSTFVGLRPADQALLLVLTCIIVVLIVAISLSTFIQHYAREIFSYERVQAVNAAELHVAHEIQTGLMAPRELESGLWSIAAISVPAKEVGGDFYEYTPALGNSIGGIAVGDVSGKGIPAALQMAVVRTIFRIEARRRIFPAETLTRVNQSLQTEMQTQGMVTLLYAFVDPIEGVMHYANAGHNYPILIHNGVSELKLAGLPLGIDGDTEYEERSIPLEPGSSVVFYTDGIVEAVNDEGELFGFERLLELLGTRQDLSPKDMVHFVVQTVQNFVGVAPQSDDMTIVILHSGAPAGRQSGSRSATGSSVGSTSKQAEESPAPVMLATADAARIISLNGKESGDR
jgi:serine phosphatase RsbU (regulator of sigma subunit)